MMSKLSQDTGRRFRIDFERIVADAVEARWGDAAVLTAGLRPDHRWPRFRARRLVHQVRGARNSITQHVNSMVEETHAVVGHTIALDRDLHPAHWRATIERARRIAPWLPKDAHLDLVGRERMVDWDEFDRRAEAGEAAGDVGALLEDAMRGAGMPVRVPVRELVLGVAEVPVPQRATYLGRLSEVANELALGVHRQLVSTMGFDTGAPAPIAERRITLAARCHLGRFDATRSRNSVAVDRIVPDR